MWVKISSKTFWKDPIKYEQIVLLIPNNNFLYQMMIFRGWSVWYIDNFMKMPQMNKKQSFYVSELKKLDKFLISCDVAP